MTDFRPARWLPGPHLQTLWPNLVRRRPKVALRRERLELPDGDFVDLDWTTGTSGPLVLVLHGLEGSSRSPYAAGILKVVHERGWRGVLLHARGCSGEPNRLPRRYHAGDTGDLDYVFDTLRAREPRTAFAVVGYSLGGNVLLNWLAQAPRPVTAAVAVSVPFDLSATAGRLERGGSRIYHRHLLRRLYQAAQRKHRRMQHPLAHRLQRCPPTLRAFDDLYTAPLHGFDNVEHYYREASCGPKLKQVSTPVLIIQARDDPFMGPNSIPAPESLADAITLEVYDRGGHVGFVSGPPWRPRYWLEQRIPDYLQQAFAAQTTAGSGRSGPVAGRRC